MCRVYHASALSCVLAAMACSFIHADDGGEDDDDNDRNDRARGSGKAKGKDDDKKDDGDHGRGKVESFQRIAYFLIPDGGGVEIVSATPNGKKVLYADSGRSKIGIVDIAKPWSPELVREVDLDGVPTSVAVLPDGKHAVAAVNTSIFDEIDPPVPPVITPGRLVVIDISDGDIVGSVPIGAGPDSVVVTRIDRQNVAVVAIENEPIVVDASGNFVGVGDPPADDTHRDISGKGLVQVILLDLEDPEDSEVIDVTFEEGTLSAAGLIDLDDPQPEYLALHGSKAAVTLQENNGIAIIDLSSPSSPELLRVFATGRVDDRPADLTRDAIIAFTDRYPGDVPADSPSKPTAGLRIPDAIAWSADGRSLFTADEGELNLSGGRGWSAWSARGDLLWDDGGAVEQEAVLRGQYPELRSAAKGVEMEGLAAAVYGKRELVFVSSERGGFIVIYDVGDPEKPKFVQLLATGWRPEGIAPIPKRDLLVTADEGNGGSGTLTIFLAQRRSRHESNSAPVLESPGIEQGWASLSGLAADPRRESVLYAVPDAALVSSVLRIVLEGPRGSIRELFPVTEDGAQAKYDLEGIAVDTSIDAPDEPGFWLASEGNAAAGDSSYLPNLLVQVDADGKVTQKIRLPESVDPSAEILPPDTTDGKISENGFQGVAISESGRFLLAPIQREYVNEPAVEGVLHTRIAAYNLEEDEWSFFLYPLDPTTTEDDWVGLADIVQLGDDRYAVIERDRQLGSLARIKRIYTFDLDDVDAFDGVVTAEFDLDGRVIEKRLLFDILEEFTPFEKVDGLALTRSRRIWAVLDNEGGQIETRLVRVGWVPPGSFSRSLWALGDPWKARD